MKYWLFNGILRMFCKYSSHNWVTESPIYPKPLPTSIEKIDVDVMGKTIGELGFWGQQM